MKEKSAAGEGKNAVSSRLGFWGAGAVLGAALAWLLRTWLEGERGGLLLVFGACVLLAALIAEVASALGSARAGRPTRPSGARPADGEVELLEMRGTRREPNPRDPRFFAFQALDPLETPDVEPLLWRQGPPPLLGKVAVVSVFLGRDGRSWSDAEIAQTHAALFRAGQWIEREAIRWEAPVNVGLADTYFVVDDGPTSDVEVTFVPEGDGVGPFEARAATKALIDSSRAARALGFRDAVDWMTQVRPRLEADVLVWLLHPRSAGRSLAVPLDQTDLAGVSLAVCYAREANFPEPLAGHPPWTDPVTIVHELLHLFGASDKYGLPLHRFPPRSVSSRDIMRLSESRLPRLRVDPRTAVELGWPAPLPG